MVANEGSSYPRAYYEMLFIGFSLVLGMGLARAFLPIFANELDPSGILVGYVVSAWFLARVFIEIPSGLISDRVGRRKLFVLGIVLAAVGSLMCAISPSIYFLIAGRAIWGFGAALFFLNTTAILIDLSKPETRGKAIGTFQGIEFIGSLIGAPIGAFLAGIVGYYNVFYVTFALISFSFLLSFKFEEPKKIGGSPSGSASKPSVKEILTSLRSWELIVVCLSTFARMFIMNGVMSTVFPLYLHEYLGFEVSLIGIVTGIRTAGFIVATVASGHLLDRVGRKLVILTGLLIETACLYAYTAFNSFEFLLAIGIIDGLGSGMVSVTLTILLSDIVKPEFRGISIGLQRTFMDIGGFLGPLAFMLIATAVSIHAAFLVGALVLLTMAGLIVTIRSNHKHV